MAAYEPISECWLPVVGFEGVYEVSDQGRVRSLDRQVPHWRGGTQFSRGVVLRPVVKSSGRHFVTLSQGERRVQRSVHRIVAEAFLGSCPESLEVCHWNDDPSDNRLSNLRFDTHSANVLDKVRNGIHHEANKTHCPQGHPYVGENLVVRPKHGRSESFSRECRECNRQRARAYYRRKTSSFK